MYAVYKEWCNDGNFKPLNRMEFMKDIGLLLRQRDYGVKIRSVRDDKVKEFVFRHVPEDETVEQEDTEGRDGRSVALGGVQSSAFDESEETAGLSRSEEYRAVRLMNQKRRHAKRRRRMQEKLRLLVQERIMRRQWMTEGREGVKV